MPDGGILHPDLTFAGLENAFRTLMTEANCGEPSTTHTLAHGGIGRSTMYKKY